MTCAASLLSLSYLTSCASITAALSRPEPVVEPSGPIEVQAPTSTVVSTTTTTVKDDMPGDNVSINITNGPNGPSAQIVDNGQVVASASTSDGSVSVSGSDAGLSASVNFGGSGSATTTETTTTTVETHWYCGMPLDTHAALINAVRSAAPGDQLALVESAASANSFTVDQAVAIITLVNYHYSLDTTKAAVAIYPVICDPGNWFKVYNQEVVDPLSADEIKEAVSHMPKPDPRYYH